MSENAHEMKEMMKNDENLNRLGHFLLTKSILQSQGGQNELILKI